MLLHIINAYILAVDPPHGKRLPLPWLQDKESRNLTNYGFIFIRLRPNHTPKAISPRPAK